MKFNTYKAAKNFSNRTIKPSEVMLGENDIYIVVCLADMEKMLKQGYEIAQ